MFDFFEEKSLLPMLLSISPPFDSPEYIFELKLDGFRCMAYCNNEKITLKSRNGLDFTHRFPALSSMGKSVKGRCILDGELVALKDGAPDRGVLASGKGEPVFAVFDILYADGDCFTGLPLMERKEILAQRVADGNGLILCGFIDTYGREYFELIKKGRLEGIVAKRKEGLYYPGKRTREWLKIKSEHYP